MTDFKLAGIVSAVGLGLGYLLGGRSSKVMEAVQGDYAITYLESHNDVENQHKYYLLLTSGQNNYTAYGRLPGYGREATMKLDKQSSASKMKELAMKKMKTYQLVGHKYDQIPSEIRAKLENEIGMKSSSPSAEPKQEEKDPYAGMNARQRIFMERRQKKAAETFEAEGKVGKNKWLQAIYDAIYDKNDPSYKIMYHEHGQYGYPILTSASLIEISMTQKALADGKKPPTERQVKNGMLNAINEASGQKLNPKGAKNYGATTKASYEYNGKRFFVDYTVNKTLRGAKEPYTLEINGEEFFENPMLNISKDDALRSYEAETFDGKNYFHVLKGGRFPRVGSISGFYSPYADANKNYPQKEIIDLGSDRELVKRNVQAIGKEKEVLFWRVGERFRRGEGGKFTLHHRNMDETAFFEMVTKKAETFEANDMIKERYFEKQLKKYEDKLDWVKLSYNPSLTPALIEKYEDKLNWNLLSLNPALTPALIEKYENKLAWRNLSSNPALTPALIEKYENKLISWEFSKNPALTPALIEKYENKLDWSYLSRNPSLTPALIEKYEDKLDWNYLFQNPSLTPALIEKYENKLNWNYLSQNPSLTPALIEKYENKLNWDYLSRNPSLTPALIEKYENKFIYPETLL